MIRLVALFYYRIIIFIYLLELSYMNLFVTIYFVIILFNRPSFNCCRHPEDGEVLMERDAVHLRSVLERGSFHPEGKMNPLGASLPSRTK